MTSHNNADPIEIAKFNACADDWWNTQGEMALLHQLNPLRLKYILQHTSINDKKILDVGCGAGIFTEALAKQGAHTSGIDLSPAVILAGRQHAEKSNLNIHYECVATEDFSEKNPESFDVVVCMELLEHVPNPIQLIKACAHLLKPKGLLFFSTINRTPQAFLTAIVGAEYLLQALPKGTHHYAQFIRPSELTAWAEQAHLSLQHLQGIHYNPLLRKFGYSDSVKVNYICCFTKK
jgi:2-polyprenyl-6-hydroxyphenyl methylase/3-demethylubiquinone-9 3-methyltransferase